MIPVFAVVGHPNKGKSSIVATLAEDEQIAISPVPGTTRRAERHTFSIDGVDQYVLVDTPGFQRAGAVLSWLEERAGGAHERARLVAEFVSAHAGDDRFHDECELLRPIVEGAGILYVVDGAKPYGPEYEIEMQVLQWTGQPRMALINLIGAGDYVDEWRQALDQYFSLVRVFDAAHADFAKRVALLRAFGELDESWRPALERAVAALEAERERRRQRSAAEIGACLADTLTATERATLPGGADAAAPESGPQARLQARLEERLQARLSKREQQARDRVQNIYRHPALETRESRALLATDLFTREGWELFGLSRGELLLSGVVSGAVAGGGVDLLLGGASLLTGAAVGALVGGAGAWFGGDEIAKVKVLGETLGGRVLEVGPVRAPNFPWVLLGRAWLHHQLVAERNHARREAISLALAGERNLMDALPGGLRNRLARVIGRLRDGDPDSSARRALVELIAELLALDPESARMDQ